MPTPPVKAQSAEDRLNAHIGGGYDPVAGPPTLETWHSLGSPGITNFTSTHGRYRMTTDGLVEFDIIGNATGAVASGGYSYANALPSAYRPSVTRVYPISMPTVSDYGRIFVDSSTGVVTLHLAALTSGQAVGTNFRLALD